MREHWFSLFLKNGRVKAVPEPRRNKLAQNSGNSFWMMRFHSEPFTVARAVWWR